MLETAYVIATTSEIGKFDDKIFALWKEMMQDVVVPFGSGSWCELGGNCGGFGLGEGRI